MIDLEKRIIKLKGKEYPIENFQVWWSLNDIGLFANIDEAYQHINESGMTGVLIRPVPVAVSGAMYEPL